MDFTKQIYYVLTYFLETIKKDLTKRFKIIEIKIYFRNRTGHYYLENNLFSLLKLRKCLILCYTLITCLLEKDLLKHFIELNAGVRTHENC